MTPRAASARSTVKERCGHCGGPWADRTKEPHCGRWEDCARCRALAAGLEPLLATSPIRGCEFSHRVLHVLLRFKHYVEENRGWRVLEDEGAERGRPEKIVQDLFLGVAGPQFELLDIDVSPETDAGRGPVDFKVSHGSQHRALIEVKLARHRRFWDGLTKQLPTYLRAGGVREGYFLVVRYEEDRRELQGIEARIAELNARLPFTMRAIVVDAWERPPGSKL